MYIMGINIYISNLLINDLINILYCLYSFKFNKKIYILIFITQEIKKKQSIKKKVNSLLIIFVFFILLLFMVYIFH